MDNKKTVLHMDFVNYEGRNVSIKIGDPREDLTSEEVQEAMELINDLKVFVKLNGGTNGPPATLKGAKVVETVTNEFDITVE